MTIPAEARLLRSRRAGAPRLVESEVIQEVMPRARRDP